MKTLKNHLYLLAIATMGLMASSCQDDCDDMHAQGKVMISAKVNSDVTVVARSETDTPSNAELLENTLIWISNSKGLIRKYQGTAELPAEGIWLNTGEYVAEGWTGDSVPASWTARYFTGCQPFTVKKGETTQIELTCKIANVVTSVKWAESVDEVLSDYTLTIGHGDNTLTFEGRDNRKGYFMMPSRTKDLTWVIEGTLNNGEPYHRTGVIADTKKATEYVLNIDYQNSTTELGGAYFTVEIDERTLDIADEVIIALAPEVMGVGFEINDPLFGRAGEVGEQQLYITASAALTSVVIESQLLIDQIGLSGADVDLMRMTDAVKNALAEKGIEANYHYNDTDDTSNLRIKFSAGFNNTLPEGEHLFRITATDAKETNNRSVTDYLLVISNAPVRSEEAASGDIWPTTAKLTASILKDATEYGFLYRELTTRSTSEWTKVQGNVNGRTVSADLTGLTPGTTYEYKAYADDFDNSEVLTFVTEPALQLPNASFESWQQPSKPLLLYGEGEEMFWDSGNHGSSTMKVNVTTYDESLVHSGTKSLKMRSQFVGIAGIGKFAAGNAFIGEYLATDGTDGILGFGRAFASRPKALKGYIKYSPANVNYTNANAADIVKDALDKGIIYFALLDDSILKENSKAAGKKYPVIVNTKTSELFSKDDSNVIAYGEKVWHEATAGDGFVEFEIALDYKRTDVRPSYIMLVCSASKGGDYFAGAEGSTMWVDDLQLVY